MNTGTCTQRRSSSKTIPVPLQRSFHTYTGFAHMALLLASSSPIRAALLARAGVPFEIRKAPVDEDMIGICL